MATTIQLQIVFPGLIQHPFTQTSQPTTKYNCIAWAAGDVTRKWWPRLKGFYWPRNIPQTETVGAFTEAFALLGYSPCPDGSMESGYEKIAIYAIGATVKHAARQLPSGAWTSKLGNEDDITHALAGLHGHQYGQVVQFLRRHVLQARAMLWFRARARDARRR
jgi:hypothetical protein